MTGVILTEQHAARWESEQPAELKPGGGQRKEEMTFGREDRGFGSSGLRSTSLLASTL